MWSRSNSTERARRVVFLGCWWGCLASVLGQTPVVVQTNVTIRVMAANLTSETNQRYESPGLRIFQGLKPDVVAIQEFNYASTNGLGINTTAAIREMINTTFGTNFVYFRETNSGYTIPNGVISRYPIVAGGSWADTDTGVNDRGFAWAQIDLPGTNDLYVVSVHLKASSGTSNEDRRTAEAVQLRSLIQSNFPAAAWIIVAGDLNVYSDVEGAMTNFSSFLSDDPVPTDLGGNPNTNVGRSQRYDRVLTSFSLTNNITPAVFPSNTFSNGLVFVSTNYVPLSDVSPVQYGDSATSNMQHMAVVKDFQVTYWVTNSATVPPPRLVIESPTVLRWQGVSHLTYRVQATANLTSTNWMSVGSATSTTTNFAFTNQSAAPWQFYRVVYP